MLLNLLHAGYFVVQIVSGLLDLDYSTGELACIGLWRRKVWRWWRTGAGITFGVEQYVPWDAPEAVVDIHSEGVVPLGSIPDVIGLTVRRPDAEESRILQGRDVRSVRVLVLADTASMCHGGI